MYNKFKGTIKREDDFLKLLKKKNIAAIALSLSLVIGLTGCGKGPEGVVATVNDKPITEQEYLLEYATMRNSFVMDQGNGDLKVLDEKIPELENKTPDEFIKEMTLKNLEKMKIIEQDAEKYGIKVTEEDINKLMEEEIQSAGGEEALKESLAKQGISEEFYKTYLERKILTAKYYNEKFTKIAPKDEDVKKYFEEHKDEMYTANVSHILVKDKKEAKDIKKELDKGANFEKLAKEKSIEPAAKESGGSLGEITNDSPLIPEFLEAVKAMKSGEISEPVQTEFGYHIIKVEDKKNREFEEIQEELKTKILMDNEMKYNEKLEKEAKIKEYIDVTKKIEVPDEFKFESEKKAAETDKKEEVKEEIKEEPKKEEAKESAQTEAKEETKEEKSK